MERSSLKMSKDKNRYCRRCGNCCRGMVWKKKYSFEEVAHIAMGAKPKQEVEKILIQKYKNYLKSKGMNMKKVFDTEWDKKNKTITVQVEVGECQHLSFTEDSVAVCKIYYNRPLECRQYLCKKIKENVILKRIKETESHLNKYFGAGEEKQCVQASW